jgi:hypothetical protein
MAILFLLVVGCATAIYRNIIVDREEPDEDENKEAL